MRKHLVTIAIILIFLIGLAVLLYPYIADYFNARSQSRAVAAYHDAISRMDEQDLSDLWEAARAYNDRLRGRSNRFRPTEEDSIEYNGLLNITSGGIMGTLEIETIDVRLPIYHGTAEGVLQVGIGHFEGTSLPVGGPGTHTVITGHRGLPSSTLLTNLDRVEIGDTFVLYVLDESLWYQVDQIVTVEPSDTSALGFVAGMDLCTLVTCTPYGINSHRLLVRGHRVDSPSTAAPVPLKIETEAGRINIIYPLLMLTAAALVIILVIQVVRVIVKFRRRKSP